MDSNEAKIRMENMSKSAWVLLAMFVLRNDCFLGCEDEALCKRQFIGVGVNGSMKGVGKKLKELFLLVEICVQKMRP